MSESNGGERKRTIRRGGGGGTTNLNSLDGKEGRIEPTEAGNEVQEGQQAFGLIEKRGRANEATTRALFGSQERKRRVAEERISPLLLLIAFRNCFKGAREREVEMEAHPSVRSYPSMA